MQNIYCSRIFSFLALIFSLYSNPCFAVAHIAGRAVSRRPVAPAQPIDFSVFLTPNDEPDKVIARDLDAAKQNIVLQTATLQSSPVTKALLAAQARGVKVEIVLPYYDDQALVPPYYFNRVRATKPNLTPPNLNVRILDSFVGLRGTVCVIDQTTVLAGSFELRPKDSSSVVTNLVRIKNSPHLVRVSLAQCKQLEEHSTLAPLCQKYALLSKEGKEEMLQRYLDAVSRLTPGPAFHDYSIPLAPVPPALDEFNKLPWPTGIDPSRLIGHDIGIMWVVNDGGLPKDVKLSRSCGNAEIDNLALEQIRQHHFAKFYDHNTAVPLTISRTFRLDELFILPKHPGN